MHLCTGLIVILLLTILICDIWVMADYAPENWVGTASLLLILSSGEAKAMAHISQRIAVLMIDFSSQPLSSVLSKSINTASLWLPKWATKPQFKFFALPRKVLRVILFIILALSVLMFMLAIGAVVFFAPIIYFSVSLSDITSRSLFILGYVAMIFCTYRYWQYCTQKLHSNNLRAQPPFYKQLKRQYED